MKTLSGRTKAFNSKEWCAVSEEIRNVVSLNKIREMIRSFIRPKENSIFVIHDTKVLKLLTHLRLKFNHLNEHKFKHGLRDQLIVCVNAV